METVLAADASTPFGVQSTWRQLVDLIGRGRTAADASAIATLHSIRTRVSLPVRAASARALVGATPPESLVRLFAHDELSVASPILRTAQLPASAWIEMLPGMSPAARSILRHRRDLPAEVVRSLESFGGVDFVLGHGEGVDAGSPELLQDDDSIASPSVGEMVATPNEAGENALPDADNEGVRLESEFSFVSIASIARGLPVVAKAMQDRIDSPANALNDDGAVEHAAETAMPIAAPAETTGTGTFQIAELVARIDAYRRRRDDGSMSPSQPAGIEVQPELFALDHPPAQDFRFETDTAGIVRWVEGAARAALIGLSLDMAAALPSGSRVDGVAGGAFRRRARFTNARLVVEGHSDAAGQWRISGVPAFDRASGRFTGYRGTARRPRTDEMAEPASERRALASDALRQLVHELRTPTNAIAGFAEMIESQMLGPVPAPYRSYAEAIRSQTSDLLDAISDIDMAARIESDALDLHAGDVPVAPLLSRIADDLAPLAQLRGVKLSVDPGAPGITVAGDDRAVERLVARLFATLVSSGEQAERIGVVAAGEGDGVVSIVFDRPAALGAYPEERLLTIDAETEAERDGAPLLGTGFALRLARNLATELGGSLTIGDNALTLRLPAAFLPSVEQVSSS